ncbi:MAG: amidohydrolase family protein [Candidatus Hydrogenedentes bacterium]|nr:amidohydrolase family protein [Candidatus Hydrogenedentota bacterium]
MARRKKTSSFAVLALIPLLLLAAYVSKEVSQYMQKARAAAEDLPKPSQSSPPPLPAAANSGETSEVALKRILDQHLVINAHEHVQGLTTMPTVLQAMDLHGMGKMILVGSSWFTITLNERVGFTRYDENNEELLKIVEKYPGRFVAYPTLDPNDPLKLDKLKSLVQRGAKGVKLYLGHGYTKRDGQYMFHVMAMDDPRMFEIYEYCQKEFIPLCFHMQPFKPGFAQEFISVLNAFPDLKVNCPHYMLSTIKESRLREFLNTFPNLYSDISFGHDDFLRDGLRRISRSPEKFRALFNDYPERFMFGTDLVMTDIPQKSVEWFSVRAQAYYDMLTQAEYNTPFLPNETFRGLQLPPALLENILFKNYERFEQLKPVGTKITRKINWVNMGVPELERQPGQAFPPPPPRRRP